MVRMPLPQSHQNRRVVITGLGVISPIGCDIESFWNGLTVAQSGATCPATAFDGNIDAFGELPKPTKKAIRKALKLMNRETQMGVAAGQQAITSSGLREHYEADRIGVCFGADNVSIMPQDFEAGVQACATDGEFDDGRWGTDGVTEVAPLWLLKCLPNMPACHLAIINDLRGPGNTITQRDVAPNMAIAEAARVIKSGEAEAMVVGGTGTNLHPFNLMHARLENEAGDSTICRPFDAASAGPVAGEGAAALVLEDMTSALARNATIFGEVIGSASTSRVGHDGATACGQALASSMKQALRRSSLTTADIGHINAHGLGSHEIDSAEAHAIREIFGHLTEQIPVVTTKGHLANAGAGAGAMEIVASLLALQHGELFPIRNLTQLADDCPVLAINRGGHPSGDSFLNLNMFGRGLASCVAVARVQA